MVGKIWLFFGCRQRDLDLYRDEKNEMLRAGVLDKVFLALSRDPGMQKVNGKQRTQYVHGFTEQILKYVYI